MTALEPPAVPSRLSRTLSFMQMDDQDVILWHEGGVRTPWDGLRKDVDLYDSSGDCLVYLYTHGSSKRPASFQIPLDLLYTFKCKNLLSSSAHTTSPTSPSSSAANKREIFIGAPKTLDRQATFRWHLTTRNFFAWLLRKPLVGAHLGIALSDLLDRMKDYREASSDNIEDLLAYARDLGYTQLAHRADNAVAMLVLAERQQLESLWLNAFSHCVGMNDTITEAPDYEILSKVNRALITKAALQMELDLEAKARSVSTLLQHDLESSSLGLSANTLSYLDHFRNALQSHLVGVFGYWPPPTEPFSRPFYNSLRTEFDCLYRFIGNVRRERTGGRQSLECLEHFDKQHNYRPLDVSRPLLPRLDSSNTSRRSSSVGWFKKAPKGPTVPTIRAAHLAATNQTDADVINSPLVHAFARFEDEYAATMHRNITFEDARTACWILVYCMLQTLCSILRSAHRDDEAEKTSYLLCCDMSDLPPREKSPAVTASQLPSTGPRTSDGLSPSKGLGRFQDFSLRPAHQKGGSSRNSSMTNLSSTGPAPRGLPLRAGSFRQSFGLSRSSRLSRSFADSSTRPSISLPLPITEDVHETTSPTSSNSDSDDNTSATTPYSEVPSLDWSRGSPKSSASFTEYDRRTSSSSLSSPTEPPVIPERGRSLRETKLSLSRSSSVYSERPSIPALPVKAPLRADVLELDKGLAWDEQLFLPGLS